MAVSVFDLERKVKPTGSFNQNIFNTLSPYDQGRLTALDRSRQSKQTVNTSYNPQTKQTQYSYPQSNSQVLGANTNIGIGGNVPPSGGNSGNSGVDYGALQSEQERLADEQVNAAYNSGIGVLGEFEKNYQQEYGTAKQNVGEDYNAQVPVIEGMKQNDLAELDTLRRQTGEESSSQIAKARQLFNELRQSSLTRFGGSSSTGEAASELLQRQTGQDMASIQRQTQERYYKIQDETIKTQRFYQEKVSELDKWKRDTLASLQSQYNQQIANINSKRAELESTKAARKLEAMQNITSQIAQMKSAENKFRRELDLWQQAKTEALTLAKEYNAKSITFPSFEAGGLGSMSISGMNSGVASTQMTGSNPFSNLSPEQEEYLRENGLVPIGADVDQKGTTFKYGTPEQQKTPVRI